MLGLLAEAKTDAIREVRSGGLTLLRVTRSNPVKLHFRKNFREKIPLVPHPRCPPPGLGYWTLLGPDSSLEKV